MSGAVRLRPIAAADLALVTRFEWDLDAIGKFDWFGFRMDRARHLEQRFSDDGLMGSESSCLAVDAGDDACAGIVDWRPVGRTGNFEIGAALLPAYRGRGIGTAAQHLLVRYLYDTTTAHRIQAETDIGNLAEQRALEKVGFRREGVRRGAHFRGGEWRDSVMYGLLRGEQMGSDE